MAGVNKAILIGNLGADPEVRSLESGVKVASIRLATTETFRDRDGNRTEHTEWHNIVLWRGLAEIAEKYLRKGNSIYLEGRIRTRQWEDKEGNTRYTTEIVADNMTMLGGRREGNGGDEYEKPRESKQDVEAEDTSGKVPDTEDDLPF